ncbi:MAG: (d)CMP kinase [Ruminococcus sp.]|nr:(d)CMP kinase [Ruminococcus sp.]
MSINIAIDGPAGAGKSTIARRAAARLGFIYVDTGALYRTVALFCTRRGLKAEEEIGAALPEAEISLRFADGVQHVILNGEDVSELIRTPEISMAASTIAAIGTVRAYLFDLQQQIAKTENILMDGRDIGTVVLPQADLKIFLTADAEERARRRHKELAEKPDCPSYEAILADIIQRDEQDRTRAVAPLKQAEDAVLVDTTRLSLDESVEAVLDLCKERLGL